MNDFELIEKYNSNLQLQVLLADTQNMVCEIGRGSGKTTEMFSPRIVNISYDMPRSIVMLVAPTYTFILNTIVPGLIKYLATHYHRGLHYEYGCEPPKHFQLPYTPIQNWKHTISFAWGTVVQWASLDVPESTIGKNVVHVIADEALRIDEQDFIERVYPTLRGDRTIFGNSHYFGGISLFSSTPNFENDHDWWLQYEKNVNQKILNEIKYVAFEIMQARGKLYNLQNQAKVIQKSETFKSESPEYQHLLNETKRYQRFIERWGEKIRLKRMSPEGSWSYIRGSSFSNLAVLGLDYMKRQLSGSRSNLDYFKLSILGIRPEKVKEMFVARFSKKHIYRDSYENGDYSELIENTVPGEFHPTSSNLKYYNSDRTLVMGYDPGNFMSAIFAQENRVKNELRVLKNFYVWTPDQHFELAAKINSFFKHGKKSIQLYSDRAGTQRKEIYANNPKGKTDVAILKRELEDLGWKVDFMNPNQRVIEYWEHYYLLDTLFGGRNKQAPKIQISQYECEELISCIWMSPLKRVHGNWIELDKTSEIKLDYPNQAWYSTQLPSALMYLLWGLYGQQYKARSISEYADIPGL